MGRFGRCHSATITRPTAISPWSVSACALRNSPTAIPPRPVSSDDRSPHVQRARTQARKEVPACGRPRARAAYACRGVVGGGRVALRSLRGREPMAPSGAAPVRLTIQFARIAPSNAASRRPRIPAGHREGSIGAQHSQSYLRSVLAYGGPPPRGRTRITRRGECLPRGLGLRSTRPDVAPRSYRNGDVPPDVRQLGGVGALR